MPRCPAIPKYTEIHTQRALPCSPLHLLVILVKYHMHEEAMAHNHKTVVYHTIGPIS